VITLLVTTTFGVLAAFGVIVGRRWSDSRDWRRDLVTYRLTFPAGLTTEQAAQWLTVLASASTDNPVVIEIVATASGISHYILAPGLTSHTVLSGLRAGLPGVRTELVPEYIAHQPRFRVARELRLTSSTHPLLIDVTATASVTLLGGLQPLAHGQHIRISWLLTGKQAPHPKRLTSLPADLARFHRLKQRAPLLMASGRIAVGGMPRRTAWAMLYRVHTAMRTLNAPGAAIVRRLVPSAIVSRRVLHRSWPLLTWPLLLNAHEAVGLLGIPLTETYLQGLRVGFARLLPPTPDVPGRGLVLARSNYPGIHARPLALTTADRLQHLWLLGPTGVGKSTVIANMALQDAAAGHGLVVVDPKADLVEDILARLPEERAVDVAVLDPGAAGTAVGFNILRASQGVHGRELAVDNVVSIFTEIWKGAVGPRSADILRNSLLTLTATTAADGSPFTLTEVAPLLEQRAFRQFITTQAAVPAAVHSFWASYEAMSPREMHVVIGPLLNKLRALTTRTSLRLLLGQSDGLDMQDVLSHRRILLVPLNKGLVGGETAALLGSLLVTSLLHAVMARASMPPSKRRPFWAYLDEFQDVLRVSGDLSDALSQARALGLGFTLAHQYLGQLPKPVLAAVLGTVRSSMVFQLDYDDAATMERRFAPALSRSDLMGFAAHEVALRLCVGGQVRPPITGTTSPLPPALRDGRILAVASQTRFGVPRDQVERAMQQRLSVHSDDHPPTRLGRKTGAEQ
jgi:Type IV secretion-system coupling protein DNA-binding domain/Type IV secretory system Conjugative DNA transfer